MILIFLPFIAAFTGWLLISIGIKIIFSGNKKIIAGNKSGGIFKQTQQQYITKFARLLSTQIIFSTDIENKVMTPGNIEKILPVLETHIDIFLKEKLPVQIPMLGMLVGEKTIAQVKSVFMKELQELFPLLIKQYINIIQKDFNIEREIIEKTEAYIFKSKEALNNTIFKKLKLAGCIFGFITGCIQAIVLYFLRY